MKKEHKNLVFSMIINIMITTLKIVGGLIKDYAQNTKKWIW